MLVDLFDLQRFQRVAEEFGVLFNVSFETDDALCPQFFEHRDKLACIYLARPIGI